MVENIYNSRYGTYEVDFLLYETCPLIHLIIRAFWTLALYSCKKLADIHVDYEIF